MTARIPALLAASLLGGCQAVPMAMPVVSPDTPISVPATQPLALNPVEWQVLPPSKTQPQPLFALDAQNYQNLSLNLVEIRRYLDEQKAIIGLYKSITDQRAGKTAAPPQKSETND